MDLQKVPKKVQYITVDSGFITSGVKNNFTINFGTDSNTFIQSIKDVIGIKLVDFYVTQVGTNDDGVSDEAKYIDIVCPDIPTPAQILDERNGQVFARIAVERSFGGTGLFLHDKQWKGSYRATCYFNPISIKSLNFKLYESQGDGDYLPLKNEASFYMVLEVTTIDHQAPPPPPTRSDTDEKLIQSLDRVCSKLEKLAAPPPPPKKFPFYYLLVGLIVALAAYFYWGRAGGPGGPTGPTGPGGPGGPGGPSRPWT
jgi:hypothetical protein